MYKKNETLIKKPCRIYFNLCKNQPYQCYGSVCARYGFDLVTNLGNYKEGFHPFHEGTLIMFFFIMCALLNKTQMNLLAGATLLKSLILI